MGARSGHAPKPIADVARALPVEMAIWDAFDAFGYLAAEDDGDGQ